MAIDDITTRILAEAKDAAEKILAEARTDVDAVKKDAARRMEESKHTAEHKANQEANSLEERIIAGAELESKKSILAARQSAITSAIDRAVESLRSMSETDYINFISTVLSDAPIESEAEIIVSKRDREILEKNLPILQRQLESSGKKIRLNLANETREIGGGVLLRTGKIEYNASLPAIRRGLEEELRSVAVSILFPRDESG